MQDGFRADVIISDPEWLANLMSRFRGLTGGVTVGPPAGKQHITEAKGSTGKRSIIDMETLGAVHEYGSSKRHIPKRPFLKPALTINQDKYRRFLLSNITAVVLRRKTMHEVWQLLGGAAKADVQKYMIEGNFTGLKRETIKRKGSSKPLIDTGQLRQSITYKVK